MANTDPKKIVSDGDYGGDGGDHGYDSKADCEVVMGLLVWWPGEVWRLAGGAKGCKIVKIGENQKIYMGS